MSFPGRIMVEQIMLLLRYVSIYNSIRVNAMMPCCLQRGC